MSDDTTPADDQGDTTPVVPTDAPAEQVTQTLEVAVDGDLAARVAELEAEVAAKDEQLAAATERVAQLEGQVADLEADPYRPPAVQGATQFDIPSVAAHEEQLYEAAVEGWQRTYGSDPVQPDVDHVEV